MAIYYFVMHNVPAIFGWTERDMAGMFEYLGELHPSECYWLVPGTEIE